MWWALAAILAVGLTLRMAYLVEISGEPDFAAPGRDALYHDYWARALVSRDWTPPRDEPDPQIRTSPYLRPPGYPFVLALMYAASGSSYLAARIAQICLGLISVALLFALGRQIFGAAVGLIAAALMSTYWVFIYYEGELHDPTLAVALTLLLLAALRRWTEAISSPGLLAGGVALGLLALVRPNALLLAPFAMAWLAWLALRRRQRCHIPVWGGLFLLGVALAVAPVTLRNYRVSGEPVLISANAGINLYLSHNPGATGVSSELPELGEMAGLSGWNCFDYPRIVRAVEREEGRSPGGLRYTEVSSYFAGKALGFIREHPGWTLDQALRRTALFWGAQEVSNDEVVHYDRRHSRVLRSLPGNFAVVLSLALTGVGLLVHAGARGGGVEPRAAESSVLLALFVAAYFLSLIPTIVAARYRVPLVPVLLLFGAYAIHRIYRLFRDGRARAGSLAVAVWLALLAAASIEWVRYEPDRAAWLFNRANAFRFGGELGAAIEEYRRALAVDPRLVDAHSNLGEALAERGDLEAAIAEYRSALALDPSHAAAHNNLGVALLAGGDVAAAAEQFARALSINPDYAYARNNLGQVLARRGDLLGAAEQFETATRLAPTYANAHRNLAAVRLEQGDVEAAIEHAGRAVELDPDAAGDRYRLGLALAAAGRHPAAVESLRRAVVLAPREVVVHNALGLALARSGRLDEAVAAFRRAIEIDPDAARPRNNLGNALAIRGDLAAAEEEFRRAAELEPDYFDARLNLGTLYAELGRFGDAVEQFHQALRIDPSSAVAAERLQRALAARSPGEMR